MIWVIRLKSDVPNSGFVYNFTRNARRVKFMGLHQVGHKHELLNGRDEMRKLWALLVMAAFVAFVAAPAFAETGTSTETTTKQEKKHKEEPKKSFTPKKRHHKKHHEEEKTEPTSKTENKVS